jgi:hypothetical protein
MKHLKLFAVILFVAVISLTACKKNDTPDDGDKGNTTGTSLTEVESWIKEQYKDNLIIDDFNPLPTTYKETEVKIEDEVIKSIAYELKPISVEDAKIKLEERKGNIFYTFVNVDTGKVNVIFKLKDSNNFGLVEPEA